MNGKIKSHPILSKYLSTECSENGVCARIDKSITPDEIAIVKVDEYYNSLRIGNRPPSTDCLISLDYTNNNYGIYVIELKDLKHDGNFKVRNVYGKFKTTFEDFMGKTFSDVYMDRSIKYTYIKLYFITDPYGFKAKGLDYKDKQKLQKNAPKLDILLSMKPLKFQGKLYTIQPELPDPLIIK